jgi:hypothetical protein
MTFLSSTFRNEEAVLRGPSEGPNIKLQSVRARIQIRLAWSRILCSSQAPKPTSRRNAGNQSCVVIVMIFNCVFIPLAKEQSSTPTLKKILGSGFVLQE